MLPCKTQKFLVMLNLMTLTFTSLPENNVRNNVLFLKSNSRFSVDNVHFFSNFPGKIFPVFNVS